MQVKGVREAAVKRDHSDRRNTEGSFCWDVEILVQMLVEAKEPVDQGETGDVSRSQRRQKGKGSESEVKEWPWARV